MRSFSLDFRLGKHLRYNTTFQKLFLSLLIWCSESLFQSSKLILKMGENESCQPLINWTGRKTSDSCLGLTCRTDWCTFNNSRRVIWHVYLKSFVNLSSVLGSSDKDYGLLLTFSWFISVSNRTRGLSNRTRDLWIHSLTKDWFFK